MEKELESMDELPLQIELALGDIGLPDTQLKIIKEAKHEPLRTETCTNPFQNVVPNNILREFPS